MRVCVCVCKKGLLRQGPHRYCRRVCVRVCACLCVNSTHGLQVLNPENKVICPLESDEGCFVACKEILVEGG